MSTYGFVVHLLGNDERADRFLSWAIGPDFGSASVVETAERWNRLHGDKLHVDPSDSVIYSMKKMVALFEQEFFS